MLFVFSSSFFSIQRLENCMKKNEKLETSSINLDLQWKRKQFFYLFPHFNQNLNIKLCVTLHSLHLFNNHRAVQLWKLSLELVRMKILILICCLASLSRADLDTVSEWSWNWSERKKTFLGKLFLEERRFFVRCFQIKNLKLLTVERGKIKIQEYFEIF